MNVRKGVVAASIGAVALVASSCVCMNKNTTKSVRAPEVKKVAIEKPVITTKKVNKANIKSIFQDIHFNFNKYNLTYIDKWGIKQNVPAVLNRIAQYMLKHPKIKIRIEGNCDERGTIEYNLVLGEKRALAAKEYLVSKGVNPNRISIISYGKSRPLDPAHNPWAWAKNRRDHFVIISK